MLNVDHDVSKVLARSKFGRGSLRLFKTARGLEFETEAPDTQLGRDMLVMLERGDYSQCSFCFSLPAQDADVWYRNENNELCREIRNFDKLYDVSIVYDPAYDMTEVDARSSAVVSAFTHLDLLEKEINSIKFYDK
jgi:HK97 family phage prohead protease